MFKSQLTDFRIISRDECRHFVENHYLGKFPPGAQDCIGIIYNQKLVGVVIYGGASSPSAVQAIFTPDAMASFDNIKELQRLYITGDDNLLPQDDRKGLAGYSIVKANDLISKKYPNVKVIVSYSDPGVHQGTVYKATGAIYQGRGQDRDRYFRKGTNAQVRGVFSKLSQDADLEKRPVLGKDRYVYPVGSHSQRSWVRKHLNQKNMSEMLWESLKLRIFG